jgi:hypothetical protein
MQPGYGNAAASWTWRADRREDVRRLLPDPLRSGARTYHRQSTKGITIDLTGETRSRCETGRAVLFQRAFIGPADHVIETTRFSSFHAAGIFLASVSLSTSQVAPSRMTHQLTCSECGSAHAVKIIRRDGARLWRRSMRCAICDSVMHRDLRLAWLALTLAILVTVGVVFALWFAASIPRLVL